MARMTMVVLMLAAAFSCGNAASLASVAVNQEVLNANPIRRVVSLLQEMAKKISAEGAKEAKLFSTFMCACKQQQADAADAIADTSGKAPQIQSDIEAAEGKLKQVKAELAAAQEDRHAGQAAMSAATAQREQQNKEYLAEKTELEGFISSLRQGIAAVEAGMAGTFLQGQSSTKTLLLKAIGEAKNAQEFDKESVASFLTTGDSDSLPSSGEITGILKEINADYEKSLAAVEAEEADQKKLYDELMGAKTRQTKALTAAVERKNTQIGELSVSIVSMRGEITSAQAAQAANIKFAAELATGCKTREVEHEARAKTRGEELIAVHDTITLLNSDDALDLFKKALPSASLLQVQGGTKQQRKKFLALLEAMPHRTLAYRYDLLSLSVAGRRANFGKVNKMLDDMVKLLKQEQQNDEVQLEYCNMQIANAQEKAKVLTAKVDDLSHDIEEQEEILSTVDGEIKALQDSIKSQDASVQEATEQRQAENAEYVEVLSTNNAAKDLLGVAKARLNKFYDRKKSSASFVQISEHTQLSATETCRSVVQMLDQLIKDLDSETSEVKADEKASQRSYERLLDDSASQRAADMKSISQKESTKAQAEESRVKFSEASNAEHAELMATDQYKSELHAQCDWLVANFDLREESRSAEIESLKTAKEVLAGADFSFLQGQASKSKSLRR